jgi:hypothetical protein
MINIEDKMSLSSKSESDEASISEQSSGTDSSGSKGMGAASQDSSSKEQLAQSETNAVFRLRVLVISILLLAGTSLSVVVYYISRKAEGNEFETQFEGTAQKVIDSFEDIVHHKLGAISSVAVAAIAHGIDHQRFWPFVSISAFQQRCSNARSLSKALLLSISPHVNQTNRDEWEHFVAEDHSWM